MEPSVSCEGAFFSRTDTSVSFGGYTSKLLEISPSESLEVMYGHRVTGIDQANGTLELREGFGNVRRIGARCILNVSGGESLKIAKMAEAAKEYSVLHFRGDYWMVGPGMSPRPRHNIYSVPKHSEYPFLDPHYIIRHDGTAEVGPTASLVSGPDKYPRSDAELRKGPSDLLSRPLMPKARLFLNREFLSLVREEWRSSASRSHMARRVKKFLPGMDEKYLTERGLSGIRHSLVDRSGFVPEAVTIVSGRSFHVLNFNSPGATGAPAYAAYVIGMMGSSGLIDPRKINTRDGGNRLWGRSLDTVFSAMGY